MKKEDPRLYYEDLFAEYPDVIDTTTARKMLGNIGVGTILKLIREKQIRCIHYLEHRILIPKDWLIEYVISNHYAEYRKQLKGQIKAHFPKS